MNRRPFDPYAERPTVDYAAVGERFAASCREAAEAMKQFAAAYDRATKAQRHKDMERARAWIMGGKT